MEEQISAKLKELDQAIAVRKKDPETARQIVFEPRRQESHGRDPQQVQEMQQEERDLLVAAERQSRQSYWVAVLTTLFTLALGLGMVATLIYLVQRHLLGA